MVNQTESKQHSLEKNVLASYQDVFQNGFFSESFLPILTKLVDKIYSSGKILVIGNGGSMCIATHFAEDMTDTCFYSIHRRAPALKAGRHPGIGCSCGSNSLLQWC